MTTATPQIATTSGKQELVGVYRRILWQPPNAPDEGRRFVIAGVEVDNGRGNVQVTVKGDADPADFIYGVKFRFLGKWGADDKGYPAAFLFSQYIRQEPHSRGGMIQYLQKFGTGIGFATAEKLWNCFGSDAARMLRTQPETVAQLIPSIPISTIRDAAQSLQLLAKTEDTRIELATLFEGRQFSKLLPEILIKKWGIHAPRIVRHDPFKLLVNRFPSCGFSRCDTLYKDMGLPLDRLKRQFACIWRALQEDANGHTWLPLRFAADAVKSSIDGVSSERVNWKRAVRLGERAGWLKVMKTPGSDGASANDWFITEGNRANAESRLVDAISSLMLAKPKIHWPDPEKIADATPHQREVLTQIFRAPVAILGGSPGTGKTTVTGMILRQIIEQIEPFRVVVCAPTNAAAVRIRTSLRRSGLKSISCGTVHSTLGVTRNGRDSLGWSYIHTKENPLPYDVIVIDESSMESAEDGADLFDAIRPGSLVLIVGDIYQLLPVGHGAPMRDMIFAGLPYAQLTEVLRNGGDGLAACRAIRDGKLPVPSKTIDLERGMNWRHFQSGNAKQNLHILRGLVVSIGGMKVPPIEGRDGFTIDPIRDVQVIVALNDKGDCNRKAVNETLQAALNPHGEPISGTLFRCGDKIICTDRIDLPLVVTKEGKELSPDDFVAPDKDDECPCEMIVKGEIGFIESVRKDGFFVRLLNPSRLVFVSRRGGEASPCKAFDLGYGITFHRSQGSQYPVVICLADRAANRVACRELWYVGTSRFETLLVTVGDLGTIHRQCRRVALKDRKTFLAERLKARLSEGACSV